MKKKQIKADIETKTFSIRGKSDLEEYMKEETKYNMQNYLIQIESLNSLNYNVILYNNELNKTTNVIVVIVYMSA